MNLSSLGRLLLLGSVALSAGCSNLRLDHAARAATGFASHTLCDDVFVAGLDADTAFSQRVEPLAGLGPLAGLLRRTIDRQRQAVTVPMRP